MPFTPSQPPSVSGILGVYSAEPERAEYILPGMLRSRGAGILRIPSGQAGDLERSRAAASDKLRMTLVSGPMVASSDAVTVCFNGNLVDAPAGIGVSVRDPAAIVRAAYRKWGIGCLSLLNGNFSVAIVDESIPALFIAGDAAHSKPLFYCFSDHLVFGSSAVEVLRTSGLAAVADPQGIFRYLSTGSVAGTSYTMLANVRALTAGQYLSASPGRPPKLLSVTDDDQLSSSRSVVSFADSADALRALLLKTVEAQSRDVRTGVALSGGVDSSGIVASLRVALGPSEPIHAFTFVHAHPGLPEAWDELPWAELAASRAGATLHQVVLQAAAIPKMMAHIFRTQDFPFGSPVIFAQAEVCRVAADAGMEVMLSGHGPDVIFGGGISHIVARASTMLRQARAREAWDFAHAASQCAAMRPERLLLSAVYQLVPWLRHGIKSLAYPRWIRKSWFDDRMVLKVAEPPFETKDLFQRLIFEQLFSSIIPTSLLFEGCNTGAYGLDNRMPYLVPQVIQMARKLPADYLVSKAGETKSVLRCALTGMVPPSILRRQDRVGFAVPTLPWLHELAPWVQEQLSELQSLPFYQATQMSGAWGRSATAGMPSVNDAFHIWRWLTLLEWFKSNNVVCH